MDDVFEELRWRGLLNDATVGAEEHLATGDRTCYVGFDPTGPSLHVGHLLPVMGLVHLQRHGHHPIALVGGGTGLVGDPSGRSSERRLMTRDEVFHNAESIHRQLEHFLDFASGSNPARMRNNLDWLGEIRALDFLRDVGKHFSVNAMLRKESVRRRLEQDEEGISFTEFTYQLMQAYDFLELFRREGCTVQPGGSDQWGNITAGIELVRRVEGAEAFGLTLPLVTTSSGRKFGKSEGDAVWLDRERTTPFRFYQFWVNQPDDDALKYLRFFTLLPRAEVEGLEEATRDEPHRRAAQRALAEDVTRRVHGEDGLERALRATEALFGGDVTGLTGDEIADIFGDVPSSEMSREMLSGEGADVVDVLTATGLVSSRGDAKRSIQGGGIYVNSRRVEAIDESVGVDAAIEGRFLVLRKGRKSHHLVRVVD